MSQFPISAYDRPSLFLSNLLGGDPEAAARSLASPHSLTPKELKRLGDRITGGNPDTNPVWKTITDISTNPLFILGVILTLKFPVAKATELAKWSKQIGEAHKKSGAILSWIRPPRLTFLGTKVWDYMKEITTTVGQTNMEMQQALSKAEKLFKQQEGRLPDQTDWVYVASKLAGLDSKKGWDWRGFQQGKVPMKDPLLKTLPLKGGRQAMHNVLRETLDKMWGSSQEALKANPKGVERLLEAMGARGYTVAELMEGKGPKLGGYIRMYFPRLGFVPRQSQLARAQGIIKEGRKGFTEKIARGVSRVTKGRQQHREGGVAMIPDLETLEAHLGPYVNKESVQTLRAYLTGVRAKRRDAILGAAATHRTMGKQWFNKQRKVLTKEAGLDYAEATGVLKRLDGYMQQGKQREAVQWVDNYLDWKGNTPTYSLDHSVLSRYSSDLGAEIAWTVKGFGKKLRAEETVLRDSNPAALHLLREVYYPLLRGQKTWFQHVTSTHWGDTVMRAADFFKRPEIQKYTGKQVSDWMYNQLSRPQLMSETSLGGSVAGYFYMSTLGMNVSPALKNLLQPVITLYPRVGGKASAAGLTETLRRIPKYLHARFHEGLNDFDAMQKVFPEFMKAFPGEIEPLSAAMARGSIGGELAKPRVQLGPSKWGQHLDRFKRGMLRLFSTTERLNRLTSYYAGEAYGRQSGLKGKELIDEGIRVVHDTQFPAGPLGMPALLAQTPTLLRQFMYFPTRYAGFLAAPKAAGGGAGTIGRGLLASTALHYAARDLAGLDLSGGLMFEALPVPQYEHAPFYPWPLVPPAVGVAGNLAQAAFGGDTRALKNTWPLLVPGGLALRRIGKAMIPKYADWRNRTPEGKIPLYTDDGRLITTVSDTELLMKAGGFPSVNEQSERSFMVWLLKNRDRIRDYRRRYVEAVYENDYAKAEDIQEQFKEDFPELSKTGLEVKKSDFQALERRRMVTRVGRVMRSLPKAYKPEYERYASMALGSSFQGLVEAPTPLGIDIGLP